MKAKDENRPRNFDYPEETEGSKAAAELRKAANGLSEDERGELFAIGMRIIYGGNGKKVAASR